MHDPRSALIVSDAARLAAEDERLAAAAEEAGAFTVDLRPEGFGTILHLILEQQVSIAAARAMYGRLGSLPGGTSPAGFLGLDDSTLRACGFTRRKAGYARDLAEGILDGTVDLAALAGLPDDAVRDRLTAIPGIGPWTADNYLLWALGRRDVFPRRDLALVRGWAWLTGTGRDEEALLRQAAAWSPRRTAAAFLIWEYYLAVRGGRGG